jgi:hypothetical protein
MAPAPAISRSATTEPSIGLTVRCTPGDAIGRASTAA